MHLLTLSFGNVGIVVVYFSYPETSRITLEEVSTIFDGQRAVQNDLVKTGDGATLDFADDKQAMSVEQREKVHAV